MDFCVEAFMNKEYINTLSTFISRGKGVFIPFTVLMMLKSYFILITRKYNLFRSTLIDTCIGKDMLRVSSDIRNNLFKT